MRQLGFGLYFEGTTDEKFLWNIIRRLTSEMLATQGIEILNPEFIKPNEKADDRAAGILQAAREAEGLDILIVHSDVDKRTWSETYKQLIKPGLDKVNQAKKTEPADQFCDKLVPLLPQHSIEAWILADQETLRKTLRTDKSAKEIGLPGLKEVESRANPKAILREAIRLTLEENTRRKRKKAMSEEIAAIYTEMGLEADLNLLKKLPSFQKFERDLAQALHELGFLSDFETKYK